MSTNVMITNQASSKIFIYNSSNEDNEGEKSEKKPFCDVTIHTSAPFEIRIKNNNYKSDTTQQQTLKNGVVNAKEEAETMKRSLTDDFIMANDGGEQEELFQVDEDVLMRSSDEKLYLGTIVNISSGTSAKSKYLVKFDDNSTAWALEQDLQKLNTSDTSRSDEPLCVACKKIDENDIVEVCSKCCRGYHRHCIKQNIANFSSPWCCERCSEIIDISDSEDNETEDLSLKFPYDLQSLKWDTHHKENKEQIYCYCGKQGIWKIRMIQCCKCLQWFHERCIESWKSGYCLMHGDTFFVFCCKICNDGDEYIRRMDFNFKTTLHLVLYDFAMTRAQKFYSVSKEVAPFLWENWKKLNIPFEKLISKEKLVKKILLTVKKEDEFKIIGMNNKKKSDLVNLRRKCPPTSSIKLNLMNIEDISDKSMKKLNIKVFDLKNDEEIEEKTEQKIQVVKRRDKIMKSFKRSNSEASFHADMNCEDSSDGNSSRSTLDWIVPIPSNFHGKNNPFHSAYEPKVKIVNEKSIKKGLKMFEKPEVRIVRTIKRRLSAKDIAAGMNQESKRRKMSKRRKTDEIEIISEIIQPLTMPIPTYFPVRRDSNEMPRNFNDGRFNSNGTKFTEAKAKTDNLSLTEKVMNSPVKSQKSININSYFGASNKIENGQKVSILAKRITFDGEKQYLLELNNPNDVSEKVKSSE